MENDAIDKVVTVCIAAALAAILIGSLVLPVFSNMFGTIDSITGLDEIDTYKTLLALIPLMVIVGIVIAIIRSSALRNR